MHSCNIVHQQQPRSLTNREEAANLSVTTSMFHCFHMLRTLWLLCLGAEVILQSDNLSNRNRSKSTGSFCIGCPAAIR